MPTRVSLSLPVCNGENFVGVAIQSILDQSFADFELIITDNASVDRTEKICRAFAEGDRRIRYVRNAENIGAAANFNLGFHLATGEYFKWCAHDDFISPNFLEEGVRALDDDPAAVVAYGKLEYVDRNGEVIPRNADGRAKVSVFEMTFPDMTEMTAADRFQLLVRAGGSDNVMFGVMRRDALANTSLHRKYYMSDRALLAELAMQGRFVRAPGIVLYNRDHPGRSTRLAGKLTRGTWINPAAGSRFCFEHLGLLRQHLDTAFKFRDVAPLRATLPPLILWALQPVRLGWYALELIGVVSPTARHSLGRLAWRIMSSLPGSSRLLRPVGAINDS